MLGTVKLTENPDLIFTEMADAFVHEASDGDRRLTTELLNKFPIDEIRNLRVRMHFSDLEDVDLKVRNFCEECSHPIAETFRKRLKTVDLFKPFQKNIFQDYIVEHGGGLTAIPHMAPQRPDEERYGSLSKAALAGYPVSVFSHQIISEPLYDATEYLSAKEAGNPGPDPVGYEAQYRISVFDGSPYHPPLHPEDMEPLEVDFDEEQFVMEF